MAKKKRYLRATMADGYVKTIGPTAVPFSHYWRIVADLGGGRTEVFWGHAKSLKEATGKKAATAEAARQRGWKSFDFEVVELVETSG
jgi:exopolyphosphatase/pppGpp-phosphohydrolase